jgi:hypothetical protein
MNAWSGAGSMTSPGSWPARKESGLERPSMQVSSVVLGAADPRELAAFYRRLLCWTVAEEYPARPGYPAGHPFCLFWPSPA